MIRQVVPPTISMMAFNQSDDPDWVAFISPIINISEFDMPRRMRLGQRIMLALNERNPNLFSKVSNTKNDIWELTALDWPRFQGFFDFLFEEWVEAL